MQARFTALRDDFRAIVDGPQYDLTELRAEDLDGPDSVWNAIVEL